MSAEDTPLEFQSEDPQIPLPAPPQLGLVAHPRAGWAPHLCRSVVFTELTRSGGFRTWDRSTCRF